MEHDPTARSRELGARLRAARKAIGVTNNQLAADLGWGPPTLSRFETGQRQAGRTQVATILGYCKVPVPERTAILELTEEPRHGCWVRPHGDLLPEAVHSVVFQYQTANKIVVYDRAGIPPILQTTSYFEADLWRRCGTEEAVVKHQEGRFEHLAILSPLNPNRPEAICFVHETTLRALPVDDEERWSQYLNLTMAIESGQAQVRIVPVDREAELRMHGFSLLRFTDYPPVVCQPAETVTLILEGEDHVRAYEAMVSALDTVALSSLKSRDLIVDMAGGVESIATPPPEVVADLAKDGETWQPWFTTEAMAAREARKVAGEPE